MIQGDTLEVVRTVLTHLWEAENVTSPLCPHLGIILNGEHVLSECI